jgi:hypothetical protein
MNPFHELRRALITAWLVSFPHVTIKRRELKRLVLMWLRTPHSTVMMWIDSDWVTKP